ncbi:MAG: pantoate kinase [Thermoplasmata archaeon]
MKIIYRSPGSITLFFYPSGIKENPLSYGSVGIGLVVNRFVFSEVEDSTDTEIKINDREYRDTVQERILGMIQRKARIDVRTEIDISQGFGTSAAGSLSTAFALNDLFNLNMTYYELSGMAHRAEIEKRSGLGDVASIITGGFTVRIKPGIPPYGFIDSLNVYDKEFVYMISERPIETREILMNEEKRKLILKYGRESMKMFLNDKSVENAFDLALHFSRKIGIMDPELNEVIEKTRDYGRVTQIMIGNSLIAFGENDRIEKIFEKYGRSGKLKLIKCGISRVY